MGSTGRRQTLEVVAALENGHQSAVRLLRGDIEQKLGQGREIPVLQ